MHLLIFSKLALSLINVELPTKISRQEPDYLLYRTIIGSLQFAIITPDIPFSVTKCINIRLHSLTGHTALPKGYYESGLTFQPASWVIPL